MLLRFVVLVGLVSSLPAAPARPRVDDVYRLCDLANSTDYTGYQEMRQMLARHPGLARARWDTGGDTALHYAATTARARLLVRYGADVNARTSDGSTPLHTHAGWPRSRSPKPVLVEWLLRHGARVQSRDEYGQTPLMLAVSVHSSAIPVLFRHGANPRATNTGGWTVLHYTIAGINGTPNAASIAEWRKLIEMVLSKGVPINARATIGAGFVPASQQYPATALDLLRRDPSPLYPHSGPVLAAIEKLLISRGAKRTPGTAEKMRGEAAARPQQRQ